MQERTRLGGINADTSKTGARARPVAIPSAGLPLPTSQRQLFEGSFGVDLSRVRVHSGSAADLAARSVQAIAFTAGNHIVFGAGHYAPETSHGRKVLTHELAHVIQQGGHEPASGDAIESIAGPDPAAEREARALSSMVRTAPGSLMPMARPGGAFLQKWDSPEHVELGEKSGGAATGRTVLASHDRDFPERNDPQSSWPASWKATWLAANSETRKSMTDGLTYGEVLALSGDMYATFDDMNRAPLMEIVKLLPLIRGKTTTAKLGDATAGRYLSLAKQNSSHFSVASPGKNNLSTWKAVHAQALEYARKGQVSLAWGQNASADHFLTDAFSGGHIRTPREKLIKAPLHAGDIESKIRHDLDNANGVMVTNARGDGPWPAFGDDHYRDEKNLQNLLLAQEAVRLSKADIVNAISQGLKYPAPNDTTVYEAERLVPRPVDPKYNNWNSVDYQVTLAGLAATELPGIVSDVTDDDNRVRNWLVGKDRKSLGDIRVGERMRMVDVLLGGVVSESDMTAVETLIGSVTTDSEMGILAQKFLPYRTSLNDSGYRARLKIALDRHPM